MDVYTRGGDKGKTDTVGGKRVFKDDARMHTNGAIDEANSFIGMLRIKLAPDHKWHEMLKEIQSDLMYLMSYVATPSELMDINKMPKPEGGADKCEIIIDEMLDEMGRESGWFILPGSTEVSVLCHVVRTIIRRAERELVSLSRQDEVPPFVGKYINRLSDLFFVMARYDIYQAGLKEERVFPF